MSFDYVKFLIPVGILSSLLICGCEKQSSTEPIQTVAAITSLDGGMSSDKAVAKKINSAAKPGAAVSLKSTEPLYAAAPGVYEYQVELISPGKSGKMTVSVTANDGVTIVSPEHQFEFELHENGEYTVPVKLYASSNGRFYVQFKVNIVTDGNSAVRVITAIFQVGEPIVKAQKMATESTAKSAAGNSETVISLPAQETISPR